MPATKIRSKWVSGLLEFFEAHTGATVFKISDTGIEGNLTGSQDGAILGSIALSKADGYALTDAEKKHVVFLLTATAASKTYTLGLAAGQVALAYNAGSETFALKNVKDDTGTSVATGKLFLVVASTTANASTVIALN